jgi:hypothetical protein
MHTKQVLEGRIYFFKGKRVINLRGGGIINKLYFIHRKAGSRMTATEQN